MIAMTRRGGWDNNAGKSRRGCLVGEKTLRRDSTRAASPCRSPSLLVGASPTPPSSKRSSSPLFKLPRGSHNCPFKPWRSSINALPCSQTLKSSRYYANSRAIISPEQGRLCESKRKRKPLVFPLPRPMHHQKRSSRILERWRSRYDFTVVLCAPFADTSWRDQRPFNIFLQITSQRLHRQRLASSS